MSKNLHGMADLFDELFLGLIDFGVMAEQYHCECSTFPPTNILMKKNKDLVFEFALVGYPQENIHIEYLGDHMTLNVSSPEKKVLDEGDVRIQKGIKSAKIQNRYYVPNDKYDTDNLKASWKDGLLTVEIPSREPKEAKIVTIQKV